MCQDTLLQLTVFVSFVSTNVRTWLNLSKDTCPRQSIKKVTLLHCVLCFCECVLIFVALLPVGTSPEMPSHFYVCRCNYMCTFWTRESWYIRSCYIFENKVWMGGGNRVSIRLVCRSVGLLHNSCVYIVAKTTLTNISLGL